MRRNSRIGRRRAFLAALLLFAAGSLTAAAESPATAFAFRNGITWDTPAGMIAVAEGVTVDSPIFTTAGENFVAYVLQGREVEGKTVTVAYYYKQARLVAAGYLFAPDPALDFDGCLALFTPEYGAPAEFDKASAVSLFNAVTPDALEEDEITRLAGWLLSDGTRVCLLDLEGELCFFCFNAPVLLD